MPAVTTLVNEAAGDPARQAPSDDVARAAPPSPLNIVDTAVDTAVDVAVDASRSDAADAAALAVDAAVDAAVRAAQAHGGSAPGADGTGPSSPSDSGLTAPLRSGIGRSAPVAEVASGTAAASPRVRETPC